MPQHKSAEKRVRQTARRRDRNRVYMSRMRTMIKKVESAESKDEAVSLLNDAKSLLDQLVGKGIVKPNKAANTKSKLERKVNAL